MSTHLFPQVLGDALHLNHLAVGRCVVTDVQQQGRLAFLATENTHSTQSCSYKFGQILKEDELQQRPLTTVFITVLHKNSNED